MAGYGDRLAEWLTAHGEPGEQVVSWIKLGVPSSETDRDRVIKGYLAARGGLDPAHQVAVGHWQMFGVLTDRRLLLAEIKGVMRVKVGDVVHAAPARDTTVEWWDTSKGLGQMQRHLVFVMGPHWARSEAVVGDRANTDAFVAAFGPRATHVTT